MRHQNQEGIFYLVFLISVKALDKSIDALFAAALSLHPVKKQEGSVQSRLLQAVALLMNLLDSAMRSFI